MDQPILGNDQGNLIGDNTLESAINIKSGSVERKKMRSCMVFSDHWTMTRG